MAKSKNALAELAEQLASIGVLHYSGGTIQTDNLHPLDLQAISKAQRIVEELAKVRCHAPFDEIPFDRDTNLAYRNCRAIAKEGVKDGK